MMPPSKGIPFHPKLSRSGRSQATSKSPVLIPDDENCCKLHAADVLCGRDRASTVHPGNKRCRLMIIQKREAFQKATSKETRLSVIGEVMAMVRDYGGRFLRRNAKSGELEEMEDGLTRELIQKAFEYVPKMPKRSPPAKMIRMISEDHPTLEEDESRFRSILSDQRKIFEALMRNQGMNLP